jgi:hypothetical protein
MLTTTEASNLPIACAQPGQALDNGAAHTVAQALEMAAARWPDHPFIQMLSDLALCFTV